MSYKTPHVSAEAICDLVRGTQQYASNPALWETKFQNVFFKDNKASKIPHAFITIPLHTVSIGKLPHKMMEKYRWFMENEHTVVYEFFSENSTIKNPHVHILIKETKFKMKKYNIIRALEDKMCGKTVRRGTVNVQVTNCPKTYSRRLNYLEGDKSSEEKQKNQVCDKIHRKMMGLQDKYTNA